MQVIVRVIIFAIERRPRTVLIIIDSLLFSLVLKNRREEGKISLDQSQDHQSEAPKTKKRTSEPTEGRYHYSQKDCRSRNPFTPTKHRVSIMQAEARHASQSPA
ncbi:hypothetical protein EMIT047CA2_80103 [Pseudomonas soli]